MSVNEKMTAIADKIRKFTTKTEKVTLDEMPAEIERCHDIGFENGVSKGEMDGKQSAYDEFWDKYQQNGNRKFYEYAFAGRGGWHKDIFKPKYPMKPYNAMRMFEEFTENGGNVDLRTIADIDFSGCATITYTFSNATDIVAVGVIKTTSTTGLASAFSNATNLHTIEKLILKDDGSQTFSSTFYNCTALKNIVIEGVIGNNIIYNACPLTKDSIKSVINALSTTTTGKTITLKKSAVEAAFPQKIAANFSNDTPVLDCIGTENFDYIVWAMGIGDYARTGEYIYISFADTNVIIQKVGDSVQEATGVNEGQWSLIAYGDEIKDEWGDLVAKKSNWTISLV